MSNEQQPYGEGGDCRCIHCGIPDSRTWVCERCQKEQDVRARKSLRKDTMPTQQRMTPEQMAEIAQALEKPSSLKLDGTDLWIQGDGYFGENRHVFLVDLRSLLAEVQRQQGEIERLVKKQTERAYAYDALSKDFISVQGENVRQQGEIERMRRRQIEQLGKPMAAELNRLQAENDQLRQEIDRYAERAEECLNSGDYTDSKGAKAALQDIRRAARSILKGDRTDG